MDEAGVLRMVCQCRARLWVEELPHLVITTDTTTKEHRYRVMPRRMATGDRHHLGRCPLAKPSRWTIALVHPQ